MAKSKRESEAAYLARKSERIAKTQEAQARQRTQRRIAVAVGLGLLLLLVVAIPIIRRSTAPSEAERAAAADAKRPVAAFGVGLEVAGCDPVVVTPPQPDWTKHVEGDHAYDAAPPAGGQHSQKTLPMGEDRFYERSEKPEPERGVHNLEHGLVVAWYDGQLPAAEVAALRQVAAAAGNKDLRFVALPWARAAFAGGKPVVLTAWGVTQRCTRVSGAAIETFIGTHADAAGLAERGLPV